MTRPRSLTRRLSGGGLLAVTLLCGCQPMEVRTAFGPGVNYQRFGSTFNWCPTPDAAAEPRRARNATLDEFIRATITEEFEARGYAPQDEGTPDFLLDYEVARRTTGGLVNSSLSTAREEGSLVIDVLDGPTHKHVWRGYATARINEAAAPADQKRNIAAAVVNILARFPKEGTQ